MERIKSFGRNGLGFFDNRLQIVIWPDSRWQFNAGRRIVNFHIGRLQIFITW